MLFSPKSCYINQPRYTVLLILKFWCHTGIQKFHFWNQETSYIYPCTFCRQFHCLPKNCSSTPWRTNATALVAKFHPPLPRFSLSSHTISSFLLTFSIQHLQWKSLDVRVESKPPNWKPVQCGIQYVIWCRGDEPLSVASNIPGAQFNRILKTLLRFLYRYAGKYVG